MRKNEVSRSQTAYSASAVIGEGCTFTVDGSCMDSDEAPIRMKDGQRLAVHQFDGYFSAYADIEKVRDKVCVIQYLWRGMRFFAVKQIVGYDEISDCLRLVYYNPERTMVTVNAKAIEQIYYVDGVIVPED